MLEAEVTWCYSERHQQGFPGVKRKKKREREPCSHFFFGDGYTDSVKQILFPLVCVWAGGSPGAARQAWGFSSDLRRGLQAGGPDLCEQGWAWDGG